jgi:hypothetical protein
MEFAADILYLDLMKKCLLASIYDENGWYVLGSLDRNKRGLKQAAKMFVVDLAWKAGVLLVKPDHFDAVKANWGLFNYTMVGLPRLDNIQRCIEDVLKNDIPGDLVETGVWRGGATIFMRAVLKAHAVRDRIVWVADSFEGLPAIQPKDAAYAKDSSINMTSLNSGGPMQIGLAVSLDRVKENFAKFGLLDDQVRFLKGWFCDTLPSAPIDQLSVLRLDGDLYQSTMDALNALYDKVSIGGYVIVDDYNSWPHCRQAVDEFRTRQRIADPLSAIDDSAVFWKVSQAA